MVGYDVSNAVEGSYDSPGSSFQSGPVSPLEVEASLSDFNPLLVDAAKELHSQGITSLKGAKSALKKAKFTLIELLVVVGIIGILASMLLPVLGAAREKARRVDCMNNQKQIMTAVHMYADDFEGFMPRGPPLDATANPSLHSGLNIINHGVLNEFSYLQLGKVYFCPSANFFTPDNPGSGIQNWGTGNVVGSFLYRNAANGASSQKLDSYSSGDPLLLDNQQQLLIGDGRNNHKAEYANIAAGDASVRGFRDNDGWSHSGGSADTIYQRAEEKLRE